MSLASYPGIARPSRSRVNRAPLAAEGIVILALVLAIVPAEIRAVPLALENAVEIAQTRSPSAELAHDRYRVAHWQRRTQRAGFRPTLTLRATAPEFTRTISKLTLPDGREAFVPQSFVSSSTELVLGKTLRSTGGEIFAESQLQRLDLLEGSRGTSYLSRPIGIGFRQSLFTFNPYLWQERIEPLRYEEARREYVQTLESIAIEATQAFFDLAAAQDQLASARANLVATDTLRTLARLRFRRGQGSENDTLQAELALLNAQLELQKAELEERSKSYSLRSYLALRDTNAALEPVITFEVPEVEVDVARAVTEAHARRSDAASFERRLLEAERDVAEARLSAGWNLNLFASFGLSQTATRLRDILDRGQEHEQVSLSFDVPILDWGRARIRQQVAQSSRSVTVAMVEQARADFEQGVAIKALEFKVQHERIRLAARADLVAERRFELARRRYILRRGDMFEVNQALDEKGAARRAHVDALRGYWTAYYELRRATLYDFWKNEPLMTRDLDW
jgi:outer membrane protein